MKRLKKFLALDYDVGYGLLFRIWTIIAGGITLLLIPEYLTPVQQGYYFTFLSVIGIQIFFELGLSHVLIIISSQAKANLTLNLLNIFEGNEQSKHKIKFLISKSNKWYAFMATILFFVLAYGGSYYFSETGSIQKNEWSIIWLSLSLFTSINLFLSSRLAICEGLGEFGQISKLRLTQSFIGYIVLWLLFFYGSGLWAAMAIPFTNVLITSFWIYKRNILKSLNIKEPFLQDGITIYSYRNDIFPLQWRIAISWASAYFIFNFMTPVVFAKNGAVEAGKIGLALSIFNSISTIGMSWIAAKLSDLGVLVEKSARKELDMFFKKLAFRAISVTAFLGIFLFLILYIIKFININIWNRLPEMTAMIFLLIATIFNVAIYSLSTYMRAHSEEPMSLNSVVSACLIVFGFYMIEGANLSIMTGWYCGVIVLLSFPWCFILFKKYNIRFS